MGVLVLIVVCDFCFAFILVVWWFVWLASLGLSLLCFASICSLTDALLTENWFTCWFVVLLWMCCFVKFLVTVGFTYLWWCLI